MLTLQTKESVLKRKSAYMRAWYAKNRVRVCARNREIHAAYKWKVRKAYDDAHHEEKLARLAKWRSENAEYHRKQNLAHYYANKPAYHARAKAAKHARKVQKRHNGPVERFGHLEIFNRDNWTCHLCGKPVIAELRHPDPMSASLDHIKPIANGGGHTRDNVACSHLRCNLSKRHRFERREI